MAQLIDRLESFCGPILCGWQNDADGKKMPFQIVQMAPGPHQEVTFCTRGLSNYPLKSGIPDKLIRHELLIVIRKGEIPGNLPAILHQVGEDCLACGSA